MYRVMLVDDEVFIVDGVCHYLQHQMGDPFEFVKAYSAQEALELIEKTRVDIVVSDIQMPGMNGFELFDLITGYWPGCRFVFLTGYATFDYVYQALQKNCVHFLLKNEGYEKIAQTLSLLASEIDRENRQVQEGRRLNAAQERALSAFLQGVQAEDGDWLAGFDRHAPFSLVLACAGESDGQRSTLAFLGDCSDNFLRYLVRAQSVMCGEGCRAWLVQPALDLPDATGWKRQANFIRGMVEALQSVTLETLGAKVSFAFLAGPLSASELPDAFALLRHRLLMEAPRHGKMLLFYMDRPSAMHAWPEALRQSMMGVMTALYMGDRERLCAGFDALGGCGPTAGDVLAQLCRQYCLEMDLQPPMGPQPSTLAQWQELCCSLLDAAAGEQNPQDSFITQVHSFVNEHLAESLVLSDVAQHIHMNPSYLSRLYKKLSGKNLFDYIAEARILRAKELLRDPSMKISQIATAVGFNSIGYFSNVFKKKEAISPQEYRRQLVNGGD